MDKLYFGPVQSWFMMNKVCRMMSLAFFLTAIAMSLGDICGFDLFCRIVHCFFSVLWCLWAFGRFLACVRLSNMVPGIFSCFLFLVLSHVDTAPRVCTNFVLFIPSQFKFGSIKRTDKQLYCVAKALCRLSCAPGMLITSLLGLPSDKEWHSISLRTLLIHAQRFCNTWRT